MKPTIAALIVMIMHVSCRVQEVADLPALEAYSRAPEHGLVRTRSVNGITTSVRLVPSIVGALRELSSNVGRHTAQEDTAAILAAHARQLCFILNLAPDTSRSKGDVMYAGVRGPEEFKERAYALNFLWEERVELRCGGAIYAPVLSTLENTYSLTKDRNVVLVFSPNGEMDADFFRSDTLELIVDGDQLGTGSQHFTFLRTDLAKVPRPTT